LEALTGLLAFAIITGLIYGRFSRAKTKLIFSKNAIIAPYARTGKALMMRFANQLDTSLTDLEAKFILAYLDEKQIRRFETLPLELSTVNFLTSSWTLVHAIDEKSPLAEWSAETMTGREAELIVIIKAYDETFCQTVNSRFSYRSDEFKWNVKFKQVLFNDAEGSPYVELDQLSELIELEGT